jgi:uncharacterized protein
MTIKTLSVKCPVCKKEVLMTPKFPDRPFCSARCKLIDLGDWASENHKIPGPELVSSESTELWSEE